MALGDRRRAPLFHLGRKPGRRLGDGRGEVKLGQKSLRPPLPGPPTADEVSGVSRDHGDLTWKQVGDWRMIVRKGKVETGNSPSNFLL